MNKTILLLVAVFAFTSCHYSKKEKEWEDYIIRTDSKGNTVKHYLFDSAKNIVGEAACDGNAYDTQEWCSNQQEGEFQTNDQGAIAEGYWNAWAAPKGWAEKHSGDCCIIEVQDLSYYGGAEHGFYDMGGNRIPDDQLNGWSPNSPDKFGYIPWPTMDYAEAVAAFDANYLVAKIAYALTRDSVDTKIHDPKVVATSLYNYTVTKGLHAGQHNYWPLDLYNDLGQEGEGIHFIESFIPGKATVAKDSSITVTLGLHASTRDQYPDSARLVTVIQEQDATGTGKSDICTYVSCGIHGVAGITGIVFEKMATKTLLGLAQAASDAQIVYTAAELQCFNSFRAMFNNATVTMNDVVITNTADFAIESTTQIYRNVMTRLLAHFNGDMGSLRQAVSQGLVSVKEVGQSVQLTVKASLSQTGAETTYYVGNVVVEDGASAIVHLGPAAGARVVPAADLARAVGETYIEETNRLTAAIEMMANYDEVDVALTAVEREAASGARIAATQAELEATGTISLATSAISCGVNAALIAISVADVTMSFMDMFYHWKDVNDAYIYGGALIGGVIYLDVYAHPDKDPKDFTNDKTNWREYQMGVFGLGFGGWKYKTKFNATDVLPSNWVDNVASAMMTSGTITLFDKNSKMLGSASFWGSGIFMGGGKPKISKIDKKKGY